MTANISRSKPVPNVVRNEILICQICSRVPELYLILKGYALGVSLLAYNAGFVFPFAESVLLSNK